MGGGFVFGERFSRLLEDVLKAKAAARLNRGFLLKLSGLPTTL